MGKPGQMQNIANPGLSEAAQLAAVNSVASYSMNTPATAQVGGGANRLQAPKSPPSEGKAEISTNDVEENQTSDYTSSNKTTNAKRRKIFGMGD